MPTTEKMGDFCILWFAEAMIPGDKWRKCCSKRKYRQYWVSLIMYKLEVVVLKTPVFWLDSRIMVMNWLWIWIWRLCAPIAKLILSGCLFYKCLSHYHVTSAVQKQRSSIQRPLSPLYHQYWIKRKEIRIKNWKTLFISVSSSWFAGDLLEKPGAERWSHREGRLTDFFRLSPPQSGFELHEIEKRGQNEVETGSKNSKHVVWKFQSKTFRTRPVLSNLNRIF